jgi:hypothetical protein
MLRLYHGIVKNYKRPGKFLTTDHADLTDRITDFSSKIAAFSTLYPRITKALVDSR